MGEANPLFEDAKGWFVIWTAPRAEKRVAARIASQGIEQWMPAMTERHRWSDRWKEVALPLFPGYLFARASSSCVPQILRTPGVITLVKSGAKPARLSDSFIQALRAALANSPHPATAIMEAQPFSLHDEVVVQDGPLAGLRGVIQQLRTGHRLVVWIEEIGRGVAFTISESCVLHRQA
jgi:transcription antitermination factor NusG